MEPDENDFAKPAPRMRLARMLKQRRATRGLSQQQVADGAGLSRNYISLVERGETNNPSVSVICGLAMMMRESPAQVFRWACQWEKPVSDEWVLVYDGVDDAELEAQAEQESPQ